MKKEDVLLFKKRFEELKKIEEIELQNTDPSTKFLQLINIFHLKNMLNLRLEKRDKKEREVRAKWVRMKTSNI